MDSSNKEGSKNDLCYPLLEHPKIECFDNSIKFLELELKREFPKGKLAQYFFFSLLAVFPLQVIKTTTRFSPVLMISHTHILHQNPTVWVHLKQFCFSNWDFSPSSNHFPSGVWSIQAALFEEEVQLKQFPRKDTQRCSTFLDAPSEP